MILYYQDDNAQLFNADCLNVAALLETGSVHAAITDPPYNLGTFMQGRAHNLGNMRGNNFVDAGWDNADAAEWETLMSDLLKESSRVIRKGGALLMFMAVIKVETIIRLAQQHGFYYKTTGTWHKTNPMPRNMNLHYVNATEAWIYFINGAKTGTFNNEGRVLHDFIESGLTPKSEKKHGTHPTQKPLAILDQFVKVLTNPGDTIWDPFAGSGSTGASATRLGRNFIGSELDPTYCEIAANRIAPETIFEVAS